jgi:hypothetical protein
MTELHSNPIGGAHLARDKTIDKISERFYCVGIRDDVSGFIQAVTTISEIIRVSVDRYSH